MQQICGVSLYCPRGQSILILLAACKELGGGPSKDQCLDFITEKHWFNKDLGQDLQPYPGGNANEPRWRTLFAWARNDAADHNCIIRGDEGYWPISTYGKEELERKLAFLRGNQLAMQLMFLASTYFKSYILPRYQTSDADLKRPKSIYRDKGGYLPHNIRRMILQTL
jgi:hypothetical protein